MPLDHDDENEKDDAVRKLANPSLTDRVKKVFSGLAKKKQNIGGHEQDNHSEVWVMHLLLSCFLCSFVFTTTLLETLTISLSITLFISLSFTFHKFLSIMFFRLISFSLIPRRKCVVTVRHLLRVQILRNWMR